MRYDIYFVVVRRDYSGSVRPYAEGVSCAQCPPQYTCDVNLCEGRFISLYMYIYIYVYIYVYIYYVYIYIYMFIYIYVYIYMYIFIYTYTYIYIFIYIFIYIYYHFTPHTYIYLDIHCYQNEIISFVFKMVILAL